MSATTLPSRTFQPAAPLASATASALVAAITQAFAPLRSAIAAAAHGLNRASQTKALRERAQAHLATDPSYAADLMAAADAYDTVARRA